MIQLYYDNSKKSRATTRSLEMILKANNKEYQRVLVNDDNLSDIERMIGDKYNKPFITNGSQFVIGYDPVSIQQIL